MHFVIFHGLHYAALRVEMGRKHLFEHPKWSKTNFGRNLFLPQGPTLVDPPLAPTMCGPGCPTRSSPLLKNLVDSKLHLVPQSLHLHI